MMTAPEKTELKSIPDVETRNLSKAFLSACQEFYSHPENRKKFEEWKASRKPTV